MSSRIDPAGGRTQFSRRTALTAAGTVASRLTGFARLVAIAYALGFERLTDTYQLANTTPNIVYELVLGGVLSATFVPVFVARLASADDDDTWRGISAIASAVAAVLVVLAAVVAVAAPWIVRVYTLGNHSASIDDQRAVATVLLRLFAPQVLFYGAVTIITALLNARRRFAAPMFAPVLNNAVVIATVLAFPHVARQVSLAGLRHDTSALLLLGGGTTVGVLAMALAQLPALRGAQVRLRWVWDPTHEAVRAVVRLSGWVFGFVAANQVALWVALALANAHPGGVSAYQAGLVFFVLPHAVVTVSVVTVLQPELAESWATGDLRRYRREIAFGLRAVLAVVVPAAAGYALLARPIVALVLRHGALAANRAQVTADVLALLAVGLPGFSAWYVVTRAFQAMQDTRTVFWLYVLENGVNVIGALALAPRWGVQGVAFSYSIAYTVATLTGLVALRRRAGPLEGTRLARSVARIGGATAAMAVVVGVASVLLHTPALRVGVGVSAGVTVYFVVARRLGVDELAALLPSRGTAE